MLTGEGACADGHCHYNATDLTWMRLYTFRIRVDNNHVDGYEEGATLSGRTTGFPDPPRMLFVASYGDADVELIWVGPAASASKPPPVSYRIRCRGRAPTPELANAMTVCRNGTVFQNTDVVVEAPLPDLGGWGNLSDVLEVRAIVDGTVVGVEYDFQVCTGGPNIIRGDPFAVESCGDFVTVNPKAPPPPVTLSVVSVDPTSVFLEWTEAFENDTEWMFYNGKESMGHDIACPGGTVESLKLACEADDSCVGFSTFGCLKAAVAHRLDWQWTELVTSSSNSSRTPPVQASARGTCPDPPPPAPACGCQCSGLWLRQVRARLQVPRGTPRALPRDAAAPCGRRARAAGGVAGVDVPLTLRACLAWPLLPRSAAPPRPHSGAASTPPSTSRALPSRSPPQPPALVQRTRTRTPGASSPGRRHLTPQR